MLVFQRYFKPSLNLRFSLTPPPAVKEVPGAPASAVAAALSAVPAPTRVSSVNPTEIDNIGGIGIRVAFSVTRTDNSAPNYCDCSIYNLDPVRTKGVEALVAAGQPISLALRVGYDGSNGSIFNGYMTSFRAAVRDGADRVTQFNADEGGFIDDFAVNTTVPNSIPEVLLGQAIALFAAGGYKISLHKSTLSILASYPLETRKVFDYPLTIRASARTLVDEAARLAGAKWWIQENQICMRKAAVPPTDPPVIIDPRLLLDNVNPREHGFVETTMLANPNVRPGALVQLLDQGPMRVSSVTHQGDTMGGSPWTTTFTAKAWR